MSFTCLSVTLVTETVSEDSLCVCCQICFSCSCLCFLDLIQKGFLIPWQQQQKKNHEIKRRLAFLGRNIMTNLDNILKSKDIILPTKVHLVKAMVFPVLMYGCESWTIKKAEH